MATQRSWSQKRVTLLKSKDAVAELELKELREEEGRLLFMKKVIESQLAAATQKVDQLQRAAMQDGFLGAQEAKEIKMSEVARRLNKQRLIQIQEKIDKNAKLQKMVLKKQVLLLVEIDKLSA